MNQFYETYFLTPKLHMEFKRYTYQKVKNNFPICQSAKSKNKIRQPDSVK